MTAGDLDGHLGLARLHVKAAFGARDEAAARTHAGHALQSDRQTTRQEAAELIARLDREKKLLAIPETVRLEPIAAGSSDAPVRIVVFHAIEDPACAEAYDRLIGPAIRRFADTGIAQVVLYEGSQSSGTGASSLVRTVTRLRGCR